MTVTHDGLAIDWLGYATIRIAAPGGPVVYVDPGCYGVLTGEWADRHGCESDPTNPADSTDLRAHHPHGGPYDPHDGDLVVVTHDHHYDDDGVERVAAPDATVLVYEAVSADAIAENGRDVREPEALDYDVRRVGYGDELTVAGVDVTVVPAYNRADGRNCSSDGTPNHPEGFGCGFHLTLDGTACFYPGDADVLDAHERLDVSLFFPSIARNFTMDRHEAAALAETLDADLVIPVHYNTFPSLGANSAAFAADVAGRGIPVALDERTFAPAFALEE